MNPTVKLEDKELFGPCKIVYKHQVVYEVNWQISHGKWFTIARCSLSSRSLSPSLTVSYICLLGDKAIFTQFPVDTSDGK